MAKIINSLRGVMAALLMLLAINAVAQETAKQTPPEGGTPKDFTLPAKQQFQLENGLRVTLVPFGKIPKATVSARVMAGNLNEGTETWLADLAADMMEEGTTSRSAEQVAREAAEMGGSLSISVGPDQTAVTGEALSEFAPDLVALMADVLQNPALPAQELDRLRRDALRNLEVAQNDPSTMGQAAFSRALYGDHPYGRVLPTADQHNGYTVEQIRMFYEDNFGARRTHVYVAGMFDAEAVRAAVEDAFSGWHSGPAPLSNPPQPAQGRQYVDIIDRTNAFSSRVTSNIREDKGYTYSPSSQVSVRKQSGHWVQQAAITTDDTAAALKEVYYEINRLRDEPPSEAELKAIQNYMAGIFTLQNSTRQGIINVLNRVDLHGLDDSYLTGFVSRVYALEPEDISRIATEYLRPEDMTLIVVGDRARISEKMAVYMDAPE